MLNSIMREYEMEDFYVKDVDDDAISEDTLIDFSDYTASETSVYDSKINRLFDSLELLQDLLDNIEDTSGISILQSELLTFLSNTNSEIDTFNERLISLQ